MHRLINNGTTTLEHVRGNVFADLLARRGTLGHDLNASEIVLAQERAGLTALTQTHLIKSWAEWISKHGSKHDDPEIDAMREVPDQLDAAWDLEEGLDPAYDYDDLPPELYEPENPPQDLDEDMIDLDGNPLWEDYSLQPTNTNAHTTDVQNASQHPGPPSTTSNSTSNASDSKKTKNTAPPPRPLKALRTTTLRAAATTYNSTKNA